MPESRWDNAPWRRPRKDDEPTGLMLWGSYCAIVIAFAIVGAVVAGYFLANGALHDDTLLSAEQRDALVRAKFDKMFWIAASGAVIGGALGVFHIVYDLYKQQQRDERSRQSDAMARLREESRMKAAGKQSDE